MARRMREAATPRRPSTRRSQTGAESVTVRARLGSLPGGDLLQLRAELSEDLGRVHALGIRLGDPVLRDGGGPLLHLGDEGGVGGNPTVSLTADDIYDPDDLNGVFTSTIVNTLSEAELGLAGS